MNELEENHVEQNSALNGELEEEMEHLKETALVDVVKQAIGICVQLLNTVE